MLDFYQGMKVAACRWHGYPSWDLISDLTFGRVPHLDHKKCRKSKNLLATRDSSAWDNQDFEVPTVGYRPKKNGLEVWWPDWEIFQVGIGFLAKKERIIWTKQWFFRGKLFLTFRVIWSHFGVWQVLGTRTRFDCWTLGDSRHFLWKTRKRNHKTEIFPPLMHWKIPSLWISDLMTGVFL